MPGHTGRKHECSYAQDWGGAQHYGNGDQLDVSDSALSCGTQWDHRLQRGHLRKDYKCEYDCIFLIYGFIYCLKHPRLFMCPVNEMNELK